MVKNQSEDYQVAQDQYVSAVTVPIFLLISYANNNYPWLVELADLIAKWVGYALFVAMNQSYLMKINHMYSLRPLNNVLQLSMEIYTIWCICLQMVMAFNHCVLCICKIKQHQRSKQSARKKTIVMNVCVYIWLNFWDNFSQLFSVSIGKLQKEQTRIRNVVRIEKIWQSEQIVPLERGKQSKQVVPSERDNRASRLSH